MRDLFAFQCCSKITRMQLPMLFLSDFLLCCNEAPVVRRGIPCERTPIIRRTAYALFYPFIFQILLLTFVKPVII